MKKFFDELYNKITSIQAVYNRDYQLEHILLAKNNCKTYNDFKYKQLSEMMNLNR